MRLKTVRTRSHSRLTARVPLALLALGASVSCSIRNDDFNLRPVASGTGCYACHGSETNAAPPRDRSGKSSTTEISVGAHQAHLRSRVGKSLSCSECHAVPLAINSEGHISGEPAQVLFGWFAASKGVIPVWDRNSRTCMNYCHGATLHGGVHTSPQWTLVDGSQASCGSCHGFPPPPPHVQRAQCGGCHSETVASDGSIANRERHVDGQVQVDVLACNQCHGNATNAAPPNDVSGNSSTLLMSVGAHQQHLNTSLTERIACSECHMVPVTMSQIGHIMGQRARVVLGPRSRRGGVQASYDPDAGTCVTYCHGTSAKLPVWNRVDGSQKRCNSCHGLPPRDGSMGHLGDDNCGACHPGFTTGVVNPGKHISGSPYYVENCLACHGPSELCALGVSSFCGR